MPESNNYSYRLSNLFAAFIFLVALIIISICRTQTYQAPKIKELQNGTVVLICNHHYHLRHQNGEMHDHLHHENNHLQHHSHNNTHHNHHHHHHHSEHPHGGSNGTRDLRSTNHDDDVRTRDTRSTNHDDDVMNHPQLHLHNHTIHPVQARYKFDVWLYSAISFMVISCIIQGLVFANNFVQFIPTSFFTILPYIFATCSFLNLLSVILIFCGLGMLEIDYWPRHSCVEHYFTKTSRNLSTASLGITWCMSIQYLIYCLVSPFIHGFIKQKEDRF